MRNTGSYLGEGMNAYETAQYKLLQEQLDLYSSLAEKLSEILSLSTSIERNISKIDEIEKRLEQYPDTEDKQDRLLDSIRAVRHRAIFTISKFIGKESKETT